MDIWFVGTHPSLEAFLKSQVDGEKGDVACGPK